MMSEKFEDKEFRFEFDSDISSNKKRIYNFNDDSVPPPARRLSKCSSLDSMMYSEDTSTNMSELQDLWGNESKNGNSARSIFQGLESERDRNLIIDNRTQIPQYVDRPMSSKFVVEETEHLLRKDKSGTADELESSLEVDLNARKHDQGFFDKLNICMKNVADFDW